MGNIIDTVSQYKIESLLGIGAASLIAFMIRDAREKSELRTLLKQIASHRADSIDDEFVNRLNQVYLKDNVEHFSIRNNSDHPIYRIVITGGPCAGKTTSLQRIRDDLTKKGFRVFSVPQTPTMVVYAGGMILMAKFNIQERIRFQSLLIRFQMYIEDYFTKLAELSKQPAIVLCDRGTVDPAAYVSKEQFQAIMDQEGWSWITLRDRRYDRVIFLNSAACGAENFYTLQNNVARSQGIEVARGLDRKTLEAWTGHPHITICKNVEGENFQQKIQRAVVAVHKTVGLELANNLYEKYLIKKPQFPEGLKVQISEIQEIFLVNKDSKFEEDKIKKRGQNSSYTYQRKYRGKAGQNREFRQQIRKPLTSIQYVTLRQQQADKDYAPVNRQRINFIYNSLPFAIDVYGNVKGEGKTYLLRFSNNTGDGKALIPPFIEFISDVRKEEKYTLRSIARIKKD